MIYNELNKSKYTGASLGVPMGLTKELVASLVCTRQAVAAVFSYFVALPLPTLVAIEERKFNE